MAKIRQIETEPGYFQWVNESGLQVGITITNRSYHLESTESLNRLRLFNDTSDSTQPHFAVMFQGTAIVGLARYTPKGNNSALSSGHYDIEDITELEINESWYGLFHVDAYQEETLPNGRIIGRGTRVSMIDHYNSI